MFFSVRKVFSNNFKEQTFKCEVTLFLAVAASILLAMCLLSFSTNFAAETNFQDNQDLQKKAQTLKQTVRSCYILESKTLWCYIWIFLLLRFYKIAFMTFANVLKTSLETIEADLTSLFSFYISKDKRGLL